MFSKALCHSLLCCTGKNKSAGLNQPLGSMSAPACGCSLFQHSISTAEAVSTAQETCCGFQLKGFSFLSLSSVRTSFAANVSACKHWNLCVSEGGLLSTKICHCVVKSTEFKKYCSHWLCLITLPSVAAIYLIVADFRRNQSSILGRRCKT